jgi:uncharacterized membrane protein (UPF0127 family)
MTTTRSFMIAMLLAALLPQGVATTAAAYDAVIPLSAFPREAIVIETRSARRHSFDAWRADTPATLQQGLMFVRDIRPDQAMIFVYEPPQHVAMWMKNTLLPLDMLFVDEAGCVAKTVRDAKPGSLDTISAADWQIALVVELKGGTTKALGIEAGDRVQRPDANWPDRGLPCTRQR